MEKNIIVVDEQGNEYEATYPKRAKGLVKNGRARFIDEHTICLACPPDTELEDKNMSENTTTLQQESATNPEPIVPEEKPLTAREIFDKITELQKLITESPCLPHESFIKREKTYSEMLSLYEKMYNDLIASEAQKNTPQQQVVNEMTQILKSPDADPEQRRVAFELLVCMFTK